MQRVGEKRVKEEGGLPLCLTWLGSMQLSTPSTEIGGNAHESLSIIITSRVSNGQINYTESYVAICFNRVATNGYQLTYCRPPLSNHADGGQSNAIVKLLQAFCRVAAR